MPCIDYRDDELARIRGEQLDACTQMLCDAMTAMEAAGLPLTEMHRVWWGEHKTRDAQRKTEAERNQARHAAHLRQLIADSERELRNMGENRTA